jgi:nucleotide-binding universal stress UspA family protein
MAMLPLYTRILVATDFSDHSILAFKHAVMLARQNNAQIYLLHVMQPIDPYISSFFSGHVGVKQIEELEQTKFKALQDALKNDLEQFARQELADFPDDLNRFAGTEVIYGIPDVEILAFAERNQIDVIVLGGHGRSAIEQAFLGSVAEKVLRKSTRPVFVIPLNG